MIIHCLRGNNAVKLKENGSRVVDFFFTVTVKKLRLLVSSGTHLSVIHNYLLTGCDGELAVSKSRKARSIHAQKRKRFRKPFANT